MRFKILAIVAVVTMAVSCVQNETTTQSVRRVKCEVAESVEHVNDSAIYPGKVYAAKEVNRAFRVAGVIDRILVDEGAYVNEGATIAIMDSRDYKLQLAATQAEYDAIKGEVDRVMKLHTQESVTDNDFDKAVNGLKQIEAKLESHKNALSDTKLTAPFSGYIQKIFFDRGATVSAGMPIISIVSSSAPEVVINIPANESVKRDCLISATALNEHFPDTIFELKHIGTTHKANLNQLYEARFRVSSSGGEVLTPGMTVMVSLNYGEVASGVVSIPFCAVVERDGASKVWLLESGKATLRDIQVSDINIDGYAIVTGGVKSGDVVITAGVNSLKEGQQVEPLSENSDSNVGNIL